MKKRVFSFVSISGLVSLIVLLLVSQQFFVIEEISCQVNSQPCSNLIEQELSPLRGKSLFFTDITSEISSLLSDESLQIITLDKELPAKINLQLASVSKKYQIPLSQEQWVIYDHSGQAIFVNQASDLPTIEIDLSQHSALASEFNPKIVQLIDTLAEFKIGYNKINQPSAEYVEVLLESERMAFIPLAEAMIKVAQLKLILDALDNDIIEQPVSIIDLRFKHPVLK